MSKVTPLSRLFLAPILGALSVCFLVLELAREAPPVKRERPETFSHLEPLGKGGLAGWEDSLERAGPVGARERLDLPGYSEQLGSGEPRCFRVCPIRSILPVRGLETM